MRLQIKRQQRDILDLQKAGISTASAIALLERMYAEVDDLIGERNRLNGEALTERRTLRMAITELSTPEDLAHLLRLEASGATLLQASAAPGRRSSAVTNKANQLGKSFPGVRKVRADLRQLGAIEPLRKKHGRYLKTSEADSLLMLLAVLPLLQVRLRVSGRLGSVVFCGFFSQGLSL